MKYGRSFSVVLMAHVIAPLVARGSELPGLMTSDAVNDALSVAASSVQPLVFTQGPNQRVTTTIQVDGETWTLDMVPHSIRSEQFQVLVQVDANSPLVHVEPPPVRTYKGVVREMPDAQVRASFIDGKLTGSIYTGTGVYAVQPLSGMGLGGGSAHAVYRAEDWINTAGYRCGNSDAHLRDGATERGAAQPEGAGTGLVVSDLGIDADFEYFGLNGSSVTTTVQDIENIINSIEPKYEVPTIGITYEITTVIVRATAADPYTSNVADTLLCEFRSAWNSLPESFIQRDHAHLFTGKNLVAPVIGVAYQSVVCFTQNVFDCGGVLGKVNYGLSESKFTGTFSVRVALTAHELGHNWSAAHCDALGVGCSIMCSSICSCFGCSLFGTSAAGMIDSYQNSVGCLSSLASPVPLPFSDDFEGVGSAVDADRWSYNNGGFRSSSGLSEPSGVLSLNLDTGGSQEFRDNEIRSNFILMAGQFNARLSYFTEHRGVEAGEELVVEYWKNTRSWVEINRITSDGVTQNSFDFHSHTLPSNAAHNEFRVRFRTEGNDVGDDWFIDDVLVAVGCVDVSDCDDNDACTQDACDVITGVCTNTPITCDDSNPCTNDTCNTGSGCVFTPNSDPCTDGDACTVGDACSGGTCLPGAPMDCDDNNVCTTDSCVGGVCQNPSNSLPCDDGNVCTESDACVAGMCGGTPIVPCLPIEIRLTPALGTGAGVSIDLTDPLDPEIVIDPGELVLVEVETLNWDTNMNGSPTLRTVQVDLKTSSLTSGTLGSLAVLDLDADDDGNCDAAAELCPICTGSDLRGVYVDTCRHRCNGPTGPPCDITDVTTCGGDFLACVPQPTGTGFADFFAELPGSGPVTTTSNPVTLVALVTTQTGTGAIDDAERHYVATFVLTSSPDARGTFTIEQYIDGDVNSNNGGSFARAADSVPILPISLGQLRITIAGGSCCFADGSCSPSVTRPECEAMGGFFRSGLDCPPPDGNGPPCGCIGDTECDDGNLCTVEFCCEATDVPVVPCNLNECVSKTLLTYGDINNDDFVSGDDVNCLLDDIGGDPTSLACCDRLLGACMGPGDTLPPVDFQKKDLAPCVGCPLISVNPDVYDCNIACSVALPCAPGLNCMTLVGGDQVCRDPNNMGDGFESGDDVNAVLDTVGGAVPNDSVTAACLACGGPSPEAPTYRWDLTVPPAGEATLTLVPSARAVRPGATFSVDLFIDGLRASDTGPAPDLRTFQVVLDVLGGRTGMLNIDSVSMGPSRGRFVFGDRTTVGTTSASRGLMLSTLPSGGVQIPGRALLGTYVLRASADAAGVFDLRLRQDGNTLLRTSTNEVIAVKASAVSVFATPTVR